MAMTTTAPKTEPSLSVAPPPVTDAVVAPVIGTPEPTPKLDQVSRIEDKTARIEEKFARSEERMMRVESALEKATIRLEGATQDMNLQGLKDDIARMRDDIRRKPGAATIFVTALISALIGAAALYALMRWGVPGVIPAVLPR